MRTKEQLRKEYQRLYTKYSDKLSPEDLDKSMRIWFSKEEIDIMKADSTKRNSVQVGRKGKTVRGKTRYHYE